MTNIQGPDTLVSLIQRAQTASDNSNAHQLQERADEPSSNTSVHSSNSTQKIVNNGIVSAATFFVPALPAASSSNLVLAPMYSGHLPASYGLDARSRDIMPDDAVSDAHLFFVRINSLLCSFVDSKLTRANYDDTATG